MRNLIRFSHNPEVHTLQREVDRLFDGFLQGFNGDKEDVTSAVWSPRVDLAETEAAYLVHLDVPGMSKDELDINFHEGVLTVSGERKAEEKEEKPNYVRVERRYGHFRRSFTLPKAVQEDAITATYENGVLDITIPKAEEVKPRRIAVR